MSAIAFECARDDSLPPSLPSSGQRHARVMKTAIPIKNQLSTASQKSEMGWYQGRPGPEPSSDDEASSTWAVVYASVFSRAPVDSAVRSTTVSIVSNRPIDPLEDFLEWSWTRLGWLSASYRVDVLENELPLDGPVGGEVSPEDLLKSLSNIMGVSSGMLWLKRGGVSGGVSIRLGQVQNKYLLPSCWRAESDAPQRVPWDDSSRSSLG